MSFIEIIWEMRTSDTFETTFVNVTVEQLFIPTIPPKIDYNTSSLFLCLVKPAEGGV